MRIRSRGVTLIEMLIVVTIIGLFTGAVVVRYFGYVERAKHTAAESQIATFTNALAALHLDCGRPPAPDEGLRALREKLSCEAGWRGPYLTKDVKLDPWGHPYMYKLTATG